MGQLSYINMNQMQRIHAEPIRTLGRKRRPWIYLHRTWEQPRKQEDHNWTESWHLLGKSSDARLRREGASHLILGAGTASDVTADTRWLHSGCSCPCGTERQRDRGLSLPLHTSNIFMDMWGCLKTGRIRCNWNAQHLQSLRENQKGCKQVKRKRVRYVWGRGCEGGSIISYVHSSSVYVPLCPTAPHWLLRMVITEPPSDARTHVVPSYSFPICAQCWQQLWSPYWILCMQIWDAGFYN